MSLPSVPLALLAGVLLVGFVSMLYLTQASGVATTGYDIQSLEAEKQRWQIANDQLRLRLAEAQSLARVEREARERLQMRPPEKLVYVQVESIPPTSPVRSSRLALDTERPLWEQLFAAPGVLWDWLIGQ